MGSGSRTPPRPSPGQSGSLPPASCACPSSHCPWGPGPARGHVGSERAGLPGLKSPRPSSRLCGLGQPPRLSSSRAPTWDVKPGLIPPRIIRTKQWCDMSPCLEGEGCDLLINRSGWTCTQPGGRIKTTTVS
ncbi:chemokine-like protein TAFA-5 isoform X2 [Camelus dromedarius]|uniref:chemokine-like protein TAFA-5 isoform X2 n=1 Tax=Camelus dromedarius TaxID=9838 RepID=UPI00311969B8